MTSVKNHFILTHTPASAPLGRWACPLEGCGRRCCPGRTPWRSRPPLTAAPSAQPSGHNWPAQKNWKKKKKNCKRVNLYSSLEFKSFHHINRCHLARGIQKLNFHIHFSIFKHEIFLTFWVPFFIVKSHTFLEFRAFGIFVISLTVPL